MKSSPISTLSKLQNIIHFEKLINSQVPDNAIKKFIIQLYTGAKYSVKTLKSANNEQIIRKQVELEGDKNSKKKFLFLDLD